tara:strand:+ start:6494 stop:6985 length:492 start_codon:yes stop_codon:yes gene_type:complete
MAYNLSSKINADNLLIDPIELLASSRRSEASDTSSAFRRPSFSTAMKAYNKKDDFGLGDFSPASNIMGVEGKKALYGDKFNEITDAVDTITMMNAADTGVMKAEEARKQYERQQALQRAACKSNKKKGLFGSLVGVGIGLATGNPAIAISSGLGGLNSLTASC